MAYLVNDKLDENQGQNQQGNQPQGSGASPLVGGGSSAVGNNVSTAGVGAGGTGGWTNIQAYLNANQDNSTTANALNNTLGSVFEQEKSKLQSDAQNVKSQAEQAAQPKITQDQAKSYIGDTSKAGEFQDYWGSSYGGPNQYSYGTSANVQNYGQGLGSTQGFQGVMTDVYRQAAGGQISPGQLALQRQIDLNNPHLEQARENLSSQYGDLQNAIQSTVGDTNAALSQYRNQYDQSKNDLRSFLEQQAQDEMANYNKFKDTQNPVGKPTDNYQSANQYADRYNSIMDFLGIGGTKLDHVKMPSERMYDPDTGYVMPGFESDYYGITPDSSTKDLNPDWWDDKGNYSGTTGNKHHSNLRK
jgi:hypothetical protein